MHTPGRSFDDSHKPLGTELLVQTAATHDLELLADRTKVVAVLRKAEEFLYTQNPGIKEPGGFHRALELAAGRAGLEFPEYVRIVRGDPALQELERRVLETAQRA
jgi:hypothetical protein